MTVSGLNREHALGETSPPRASTVVAVTVLCLAGGLLLTAAVVLDFSAAATSFAVALTSFTIVSAWPLVSRVRAGTFDPFELPVWTTVEQWLRLGLLSIVFFAAPETWLDATFEGELDWLNTAIVCCALATPFLWLGFRSKLAARLGRLGRQAQHTIGVRFSAILVVYGAVVAARLYLIRLGIFGYLASVNEDAVASAVSYQQLFHLLEAVSICPLLALLVRRERLPGAPIASNVAFYSMLVVEFGFRLMFGNKGQIAFLFLMLGIADYILRRRLVRYLPAGVLLLFVIVPVNLQYRQAILAGAVDTTDVRSIVATVADIAWNQLSSAGAVETVAEGAGVTATYSAQLQNLAAVMRHVHTVSGFQWGIAWLDIPAILLVPQAMWPDKPTYPFDGVWMTKEVLNLRDNRSATTVPMQADFYLHFGLPGMMFGMFLMGFVQRALIERYRRADNVTAALVYPMIALTVGPAFTVVGLVGVVRLLIVLYVVQKLFLIRHRRHDADDQPVNPAGRTA